MKMKKFVSAVAALTMMTSAFSGLTLTVNAEETTAAAALVHTASAQGGSNTAGTFLDVEQHYVNNWGTSGWAATGYIEFSIADLGLTADNVSTIKDATLTVTTWCGGTRDNRVMDVILLDADTASTIDLTESVSMIAKPSTGDLITISPVTRTETAKTTDFTNAIKSRISNGETRFIFACANAAAGGYFYGSASAENAPKLEITTTDAAMYDVTVNCVDEEGNVLRSSTETVADGTEYTPVYDSSFNMDGYKYTYASGAGTVTISGTATIDIIYSKRALDVTTVTLNAKLGDTTEKLSENSVTEDSSVTIPYSKYIVKDNALYTVAAQAMTSGTYHAYTVTGTREDQEATVTYSADTRTPVYFAETEDKFADSTVSNSLIRCSNGACYNFGADGEDVVKLSAGTYEIETAVWGSKDHTYSFKTGETEILSLTTTGSLAPGTAAFTLENEAVLSVSSDGTSNSGVDYILITGTGTATEIDAPEEPTQAPGEEATEAPTQAPTEAPTDAPTEKPTTPPETVATTYVDETFTYDDQEIIRSAGNDVAAAPDPVTIGSIVYSAGRRDTGPINDIASIASNELYISADKFATNSRGISFSFANTVSIPNMSELGPDAALEMSFKVKATNSFTVLGYGDISTADLTTTSAYVNVRIILDNALNKQILLVTDTDGKVLTSKVSALTASTFTGMTFYAGTGTFNVDDLKITSDKSTVGLIAATVTGADSATLTVDGATFTTGTAGEATYIALPAGEYTVTASKSGYEHTSGAGDNHTLTVTTAAGTTADAAFTLSLRTYIKLPETVTIGGGQSFIAASDETASTAAFTASVLDQYGIPMTTDEYTLAWEVYPSGTNANDGLVTIDKNGVVSVSSTFHTDNDIAAYDVHAIVKTDDRGQDVKETIYVGNNDIIYYEPMTWAVANGTRSAAQSLASAVELADISAITINLAMNYTEGQSTFVIKGDKGTIVGLQHAGTTITAWTGWTGNSTFNQSGDVGKFTNSAVLLDSYTDGTAIDITFTIDKTNNSVTVASGASTVTLPLTAAPTTITGFQMGQYRTYGGMTLTNVMVKEPNANYLAIVGDTDFAKVGGNAITRQYSLSQSVIVPNETFTWTVAKADGTISAAAAATGVKFAVAAAEADRTVKAYKAAYNADGTLASLVISDVTIPAGAAEVTVEAEEGVKVMLWSENNTPLANAAAAAVIPADPTDAPTQNPGAAAVTIDNNGILTVNDTAEAGTYVITATSDLSDTKTASLEITIDDFQKIINISYTGANAYDVTETTGTYEITSMTDKYDDEMIGLITDIVWTSSNTSVVTVTADGALTVVGAGSAELTATITNGTAVTTLAVPVTVAAYYITGDASGNETSVDTSALVTADSYVVTTATADGTLVNQTTVTEKPSTVDTTGAAKYEIAPVFSTESIGSGAEFVVPADTYDFTVSGEGSRVDVYVNEQMIVNNLMQGGSVNAVQTVKDLVVSEGKAVLTLRDSGGTQTVSASFRKSPSIVTRAQKVYVLGDSLTCIYYNNQGPKDQTGWGQVLGNFIKDGIEVVDLGNSGVTAVGLSTTAITQPVTSGQEGDILLLESGYNDRSYTTQEAMINAVTSMYNAATAKGLKVILVSPTASSHDYKPSVAWTSVMASTAETLGADYIDVSELSYNVLHDLYGDDTTDMLIGVWNVSDGLHSTYDGAMKVASIVASQMIALGLGDVVDTEYSYTWTDAAGNSILCQAAATPAADNGTEAE